MTVRVITAFLFFVSLFIHSLLHFFFQLNLHHNTPPYYATCWCICIQVKGKKNAIFTIYACHACNRLHCILNNKEFDQSLPMLLNAVLLVLVFWISRSRYRPHVGIPSGLRLWHWHLQAWRNTPLYEHPYRGSVCQLLDRL